MSASTENFQRRALRRNRLIATALLGTMAILFIVTTLMPQPGFWIRIVRAAAEAAVIGGLADWFAVTALFRRPLGLPIPHTAIIPASKDRIGEGLARFLDRHFLNREVLIGELRSLNLAAGAAAWLAHRRNPTTTAAEITKALPLMLRAVDDRKIKLFLVRTLGAQLRPAPIAALAGQLMQRLMAAGYHERVLDGAFDYAQSFLAQNEE